MESLSTFLDILSTLFFKKLFIDIILYLCYYKFHLEDLTMFFLYFISVCGILSLSLQFYLLVITINDMFGKYFKFSK